MQQQDLFTDLPRGEQLAALRRLRLTAQSTSGGKVSAAVQKSVLKAIDDHQGQGDCFATQETIAAETGYGVSTIRRAIVALIDQDLITKERPNHWSPNRHRLNWTAIHQLATGFSERSTAQ